MTNDRLAAQLALFSTQMADDPTFASRFHRGEVDLNGNPVPRNPEAVETAFELERRMEALALVGDVVTQATRSRLGGLPDLPNGLEWPERQGIPLTFVAQIDFAELPRTMVLDWLPTSGLLFFFVTQGLDIWNAADRSLRTVLYALPNDKLCNPVLVPENLPEVIGARNLSFRLVPSYRPISWMTLEGLHHGADFDEFSMRLSRLDKRRDALELYQIGGWPELNQEGYMPLQCEHVVTGASTALPHDWRNQANANANPGGWRLLLQLELAALPGRAGGEWEEHGYFWVREADARRCDFSNVLLFADSD